MFLFARHWFAGRFGKLDKRRSGRARRLPLLRQLCLEPLEVRQLLNTATWIGNDCPENRNWSDPGNWDGGGNGEYGRYVPQYNDDLVFPQVAPERRQSVDDILIDVDPNSHHPYRTFEEIHLDGNG